MMDTQLTVQTVLRQGQLVHGDRRVLTYNGRDITTATFAEVASRVGRLAHALQALGVKKGDCVASFCWNHQAHLEAYLAVPSMGAVLNTVNVRLAPAQISYVMEEVKSRIVVADGSLLHLLAPAIAASPTIEAVIVVGTHDGTDLKRPTHSYDQLLSAQPADFAWPAIDERAAAVCCFTSGTTGNPKGVVYSHRAIVLHAMQSQGVDSYAICQADRVIIGPSMYHATAWGLPFSGWSAGAELILPNQFLQAPHLRKIIGLARPTVMSGVPTILNDLLRADIESPIDMSSLRRIISGGSALPHKVIVEMRQRWKVPVLQGYGMTETGPLATVSVPPERVTDLEEHDKWRAHYTRPLFGLQLRIADESGKPVINEPGEIQMRGPWVTASYYGGRSQESFTSDGWLRSGDIGISDEHCYVKLTDRAKDVIKSGGEWISSVDLEAALIHQEAVAEIAVVAIADPRWDERPLAVIVAKNDRPDPRALRKFLSDRVAKFWIPEYWSFVPSLPKTSVGKIDKKRIRDMVKAGEIAVQRCAE